MSVLIRHLWRLKKVFLLHRCLLCALLLNTAVKDFIAQATDLNVIRPLHFFWAYETPLRGATTLSKMTLSILGMFSIGTYLIKLCVSPTNN